METKIGMVPLEAKLQALLDQRRKNARIRNLTLPTPGSIDFSSNDFLSLATSDELKSAYLSELQGTPLPMGSGGSRLLDGNSPYAEALEHEIAEFHGAEAGLLFNSGFDANTGFFSSVPQPGDVIVYDELVHASVHDGMRLSRAAETIPFQHNSVTDLQRVLKDLCLPKHRNHVFVAVESIYSMDGDVSPLREIVEVVENVMGKDASHIIVDEAHSTGVLGPHGRGLVCDLKLEDRIFARLHTFGKALASNGAILLGSHTLRHYLINYARPLIYTTFLSYPSLSLVRSAYQLLSSGKTAPLQEHLHDLTQCLFTSLRELHKESFAARGLLGIPNVCPQSPIFAIHLEQPKELAGFLQGKGMMVRAVVAPTVPRGTERVRVCLHANNTMDEVGLLIRTVREWCESRTEAQKENGEALSSLRARL